MLEFLSDVTDTYLYSMVIRMFDIVEIIRMELLGYSEFLPLIVNKTISYNSSIYNAISKKYAKYMSESFILRHQDYLNWRNICMRRDLSYDLLCRLKREHTRSCLCAINFIYSQMSIDEIIQLVSCNGISFKSVIPQLEYRDLSSSEIDLLISLAYNSMVRISLLPHTQLLSKQQIERINNLTIMLGQESDKECCIG
jgi:hypothetical protein